MTEVTDQVTDRLLTASDPVVHELLGVAGNRNPAQSAWRLAREKKVPHVRVGQRLIRFSLAALRRWAEDQSRENCVASAAQK